MKELTEAAARGATGPLTSTIVELSQRLGVTEDATQTLLRIVGERDVPPERLSETLGRVANDYNRLRAQVAALNPDNPTARGLVERAKAEITAGHFAGRSSTARTSAAGTARSGAGRESGTARLEEAVAAYNAASEVYIAAGAD